MSTSGLHMNAHAHTHRYTLTSHTHTLLSFCLFMLRTESSAPPHPPPSALSQLPVEGIFTPFPPPGSSVLMKFPLIIVLKFLGPVIDKRIMTSKGRLKSLTPS